MPLVILTARNICTATTCCMCIFCYFFLSFRQQREQQPDQHHRGANLREPLQLNRNVSLKKKNSLAATSFVQEWVRDWRQNLQMNGWTWSAQIVDTPAYKTNQRVELFHVLPPALGCTWLYISSICETVLVEYVIREKKNDDSGGKKCVDCCSLVGFRLLISSVCFDHFPLFFHEVIW